jgi:hypothetical protein
MSLIVPPLVGDDDHVVAEAVTLVASGASLVAVPSPAVLVAVGVVAAIAVPIAIAVVTLMADEADAAEAVVVFAGGTDRE